MPMKEGGTYSLVLNRMNAAFAFSTFIFELRHKILSPPFPILSLNCVTKSYLAHATIYHTSNAACLNWKARKFVRRKQCCHHQLETSVYFVACNLLIWGWNFRQNVKEFPDATVCHIGTCLVFESKGKTLFIKCGGGTSNKICVLFWLTFMRR